jgi:hypothetical protein
VAYSLHLNDFFSFPVKQHKQQLSWKDREIDISFKILKKKNPKLGFLLMGKQ